MTIYYDTFAGLIPVQFIGWAKSPIHDTTGCFNAVVRLKASKGGYQRGEVLHLPAWSIVVKDCVRNYQQRVRPAQLPAIDPDKLLPARF